MTAFGRGWWLAAAAASFIGYFCLLAYCDLAFPEYLGAKFLWRSGRPITDQVAPGSPADRAGLAAGDVLVSIDGHLIAHRLALAARDENLEFGRPRVYEVEREGHRFRTTVTIGRAAPGQWRTRERLVLLGLRCMQFSTLALGIFVAWRRPHDPVARLGALFLASTGVFSVTLPYRMASVWHGLPPWAALPLWLPFLASSALGGIAYAFFSTFPDRLHRGWIASTLALLPMAVALAMHVGGMVRTVYWPHASDGIGPWPDLLPLFVNVAYLVAGLIALVLNYRALADANARRRVRVLVFGSLAGFPPGALVVLWYWLGDMDLRHSLFGSGGATAGAFFFVTFPASFAYALLRHRLFDLRVMVRIGLQYALARRALLSIVPLILVAAIADILGHGSRPLIEVIRTRGATYALIVALAVVAYTQRRRWLDALDRRFFREGYDARQLLGQLLADIRHTENFEQVAPRVVSQIEAAIHPESVAVFVRLEMATAYNVIASAPGHWDQRPLPATMTLIELVRLLKKPIDAGRGDSAWLQQQLPEHELELLEATGIDLVVPVSIGVARSDVLLTLGRKRSEEPYSGEDRELLMTIAESLAILVERPSRTEPALADTFGECPSCGNLLASTEGRCPDDGSALAPTRSPRTLASRYRLERRIGRGGMGTVYAATDTALDRHVAVKMLREDLVGHPEAAHRFQQEARVVARFAHPNVVTVHDVGVTDGNVGFLVMELLHGYSLRAAVHDQVRLAPVRACRIVQGVAAAVDEAHQRGLVHRDLKPDNIFLTGGDSGETPKVLDFGIAKSFAMSPDGDTNQTRTGVLVGTPAYMAPEQLRGGDPRPNWDLWALGVVAFEMLTGALPFATAPAWVGPGFDTSEAAAALASSPASWQDFFGRALSIDPDRRFQTAREFAREFEKMVG